MFKSLLFTTVTPILCPSPRRALGGRFASIGVVLKPVAEPPIVAAAHLATAVAAVANLARSEEGEAFG